MTEHDPLCPASEVPNGGCLCLWIRDARADERQRIAQAIEHFGLVWRVYLDSNPTEEERGRAWSRVDALEGAARIARNGAQEEVTT